MAIDPSINVSMGRLEINAKLSKLHEHLGTCIRKLERAYAMEARLNDKYKEGYRKYHIADTLDKIKTRCIKLLKEIGRLITIFSNQLALLDVV